VSASSRPSEASALSSDESDGIARAVQVLLRGAHLAATSDVPELVALAASAAGARSATVLLVEYDLRVLVPFTTPRIRREPVPIAGTLPGKAFAEGVPISSTNEQAPDAGNYPSIRPGMTGVTPDMCWLPLLDGTNRLGVLELELEPGRPLPADGLEDLASLVAQVVVTRSSVGDWAEMTRRLGPMRLESEMQWKLLPPLSFGTVKVSVVGSLVPAREVAGDSFDYALNGQVLHVGLFDAMGHGLSAALLAALVLAAYRNGRRTGLELADVVRSIDKFVSAQFTESFATAIVGQLDVDTGVFEWASCGHPAALLVRDGRVVKTLDGGQNLPLGLQGTAEVALTSERLQPHDRLLLYSDGVVEARNIDGEWFGTDRLVDEVTKASSAALPAAETMRRLVHGILDHQHGDMQDDATTVLVEWHGADGDPAR